MLAITGIALLIFFGVFWQHFPRSPDEESRIEEETRTALALEPADEIHITASSKPFYRLNVVGAAGGGIWVIVEDRGSIMAIVAKGQDYPQCGPLEAAGVPVALEPYCWSADHEGRLLDRLSGLVVEKKGGQGL